MRPKTHLYLLLAAAICSIYLLNSFTTVPGDKREHERSRESSSRYGFGKIEIQRINWDELYVKYTLKSIKQGEQSPKADRIEVSVLDAKGKLIGHSLGKRVLLDDAKLGSEESYTIEVEITVGSEVIYHTEEFVASKKKVSLQYNMHYPLKKQLFAGNYNYQPQLSRQVFGSAAKYEAIALNDNEITSYLTLENSTQPEKKMAVSIAKGTAEFELQQLDGYSAWKQTIEKEIVSTRRPQKITCKVVAYWKANQYVTELPTAEVTYADVQQNASVMLSGRYN